MTLLEQIEKMIYEGDMEINSPNDDIMEQGISVEKGFTEEDADPEQLSIGVKIEMEHTTNPDVAKKIALDHLSEIPDYYTRLVKMEQEAGRNLEEYLNMDIKNEY